MAVEILPQQNEFKFKIIKTALLKKWENKIKTELPYTEQFG